LMYQTILMRQERRQWDKAMKKINTTAWEAPIMIMLQRARHKTCQKYIKAENFSAFFALALWLMTSI